MYRTHTCGELNLAHVGSTVVLAGWLHRRRDHGNLMFLDIRDHYGITQCVISGDSEVPSIPLESVLQIQGKVVARDPSTINANMMTGEIELSVMAINVLSKSAVLPLNVNTNQDFPEDTRLKYRFLDLRRENMHKNIILRSKVIATIRTLMQRDGFLEIQTPILTSSSPEGARDFLVPSRIHPGKFYALPQAPQIFKQLLMVSGFDKYFQISPCFRDEDARADRSPGEFYQLDFEMSFVEQQDVFATIEPVLYETFNAFSANKTITKPPFPKITYADAMLEFGSDKPDLRNPLRIKDVTEIFKDSSVEIFTKAIAEGSVVRAIAVPNLGAKTRSFFDDLQNYAKEIGLPGLGYISLLSDGNKGPLAKFFTEDLWNKFSKVIEPTPMMGIFFIAGPADLANKASGLIRTYLCNNLNLLEKDTFKFCWIVDFPMYEKDSETGKIDFCHNPFSMPQGGLQALLEKDPLDILAYQYDIVCNGVELSSGAIRNHIPEIMYKAFEIAGYSKEDVEAKFSCLLNAFQYGAPPHGGCAPGIDRIVMLLAEEENIREIIAFPFNQKAEDLLMNAPSFIPEERLKELYLKSVLPEPKKIAGASQ